MKFLETVNPTPPPEPEVPEDIKANGLEFISTVEKHLADQSAPYFRTAKGFSPSSTNDCARLAVYLLEGVEVRPSVGPQLRRIFDNGNYVQNRISSYIKPYIIEEERRILTSPVPISGYIDFVIKFNEIEYILETKSINERGFEARKNLKRPKDDHYRQIQLYMHATGIHQGFVWYESKNTQEWLTLFVTYNEPFVKEIVDRYAKIYTVHLNGDIPKRPHKQTTKVCMGCDVKDRCWSDEREGTQKL